MKNLIMALLTVLVLISCSSKNGRNPSWDSGAQRQEAIEDETRNETQDRLRNQFPGERSY